MISRRNSVRLPYYDYRSAGGYFITICTDRRRPIFATNRVADTVRAAWCDVPNHHAHVQVGEFVVMPNHVHGIVFLVPTDDTETSTPVPDVGGVRDRAQRVSAVPDVGGVPDRAQRVAPLRAAKRRTEAGSLGVVVRSFKARVTRDLRAILGPDEVVWQRNYYEHVIRSEAGLERIRRYIITNPERWAGDPDNPDAVEDPQELAFATWIRSDAIARASGGISTP